MEARGEEVEGWRAGEERRLSAIGAGGIVGSNLADTLSQNHAVVIIDNLATGRRENVEHLIDHPRVEFIEGSITDLDLLREAFPGAAGIFGGHPCPGR